VKVVPLAATPTVSLLISYSVRTTWYPQTSETGMITGITYDHEMMLVLDLQKCRFVSGIFCKINMATM